MAHQFGGPWTEKKLAVLSKYLRAYMQILKERPFHVAYIDAFAGTGRVESGSPDLSPSDLFDDLSRDDLIGYFDGSARIALTSDPPFQSFIFIERNPSRAEELRSLRDEFPDKASAIRIECGNANDKLRELCAKNWNRHRAVLFLDPYGMQVNWATIEAIAETRAIDLMVLFPSGVAVNRMLPDDFTSIPQAWKDALNRLFGTDEWADRFYGYSSQSDLFNASGELTKQARIQDIAAYYVERMTTVFPAGGVVEEPLALCTPKGRVLYHLCFATANPRAAATACKIVRDIFGKES
ncbi:MAG: hypothetical protein PWP23_1101 [Candidatus Sumerlaeota bacterium]|nr:hypothetical protein [Candidatus Sumerlaeota bacterium]